MLKVGLVGCGAIGFQLARIFRKKYSKSAELAYLSDQSIDRAQSLKKKLRLNSVHIVSISELVRKSNFIIEAASQQAVTELVPIALRLKKHVMVMSVGGLLRLPKISQKSKGYISVPSGAIAGIDALLAAKMSGIKYASITTRKPADSLKDAPFFKLSKTKIDLSKIKKPTVIFRGNAFRAAQYFPQNINVAATLSLAGIGPKRTQVTIVASPTYKRNIHEIEVVGNFGRFHTITENLPSKENPKTSALAFYSAMACLDKMFSPLKVGT